MNHFSPSTLVLDEMADLALYQNFRKTLKQPELIRLFDKLILEEKKHVAFWYFIKLTSPHRKAALKSTKYVYSKYKMTPFW